MYKHKPNFFPTYNKHSNPKPQSEHGRNAKTDSVIMLLCEIKLLLCLFQCMHVCISFQLASPEYNSNGVSLVHMHVSIHIGALVWAHQVRFGLIVVILKFTHFPHTKRLQQLSAVSVRASFLRLKNVLRLNVCFACSMKVGMRRQAKHCNCTGILM